ncbi:hypothetical protein H058_19330 [Vibrio antiquarius]|nr:hypothetical protein H058_19330 [Vibrio antiquarius]
MENQSYSADFQQDHRAELQLRTDVRLPCSVSAKEQKYRLDTCKTLDLKQLKLSFDHDEESV